MCLVAPYPVPTSPVPRSWWLRVISSEAASHFAAASLAPVLLWRDLMPLARAASQDDYGRIARAVGRIVPEFQPAAALDEVAATASGAGAAVSASSLGPSGVAVTDHSGEGSA